MNSEMEFFIKFEKYNKVTRNVNIVTVKFYKYYLKN